ncbi:hypothetical protein IWW55_000909 [Coemansia sp. RSA 2706]|nr:hypothetical protein LPJ63_003400 [Coemansia sp. RSA 2711]KAJ1838525.1 hypothetical protein LPJ70_005423 [Coemansia sp. RSA 2708]KAJ2305755.1 hypothetical protein IWW52_006358 [Coemansia sp. RSA 2704]KAJ2307550.1 hypothetical protein IWW55_000909 [Coemansia sp. RSA 2706]KAJ2316527.1 hypothetical protein IWW51_005600 [Coemansia sp. RSA 2702]KAJ2712030.1 hypothetical protein H4R23_006242 [Coemansia sp. Cherry 401B]
MVDSLVFRNLQSAAEVRQAWPLEASGYPEDEAASLDALLYRFNAAPHLFFGAFTSSGDLVGYVVSTQTSAPLVTHESMSTHDAQGTTGCVHSVCVASAWQRKGLATKLLRLYTESVREYNQRAEVAVNRLALISHKYLLPLYEKAGYRVLGVSDVVHGSEPWFDCVLDL